MGINAEYMGTLIQTSLPNSNPLPQKDFLSTKAFSLTRERHRLVPMRQVDSVAENDAQLLKLNNAVSGLPSSGRKTRVGRIWHFLFMTYIRTYMLDGKPLRHKLQSTPPFRVTEDGKNQVRREDRGQHPRQIRLQLLHVGQRRRSRPPVVLTALGDKPSRTRPTSSRCIGVNISRNSRKFTAQLESRARTGCKSSFIFFLFFLFSLSKKKSLVGGQS